MDLRVYFQVVVVVVVKKNLISYLKGLVIQFVFYLN